MQVIQYLGVILMIVTSHGEMDNGKPTGLWLEEFAVPYEQFTEAGYRVIVASPQGGKTPVDPRSMTENLSDRDKQALKVLEDTVALGELEAEYQAVFFSGGHGTMFDFPKDKNVSAVVEEAFEKDLPIALVCHGPAALVAATLNDGSPAVKGRKLTGFTNSEEEAVKLTEEMPFLLEDKLIEQGASFSSKENFKPHVVTDGNLVTGQNPASSKPAAAALLKLLQK
ncbi:type 1 glutamine amidotransferase domain-containing protein [Kiritimatiellaeota bacterium B1221]|nr:type 1 glutamine amidotransferase domain-containing protein [Kiritimatiellaeota bacterium B1221]